MSRTRRSRVTLPVCGLLQKPRFAFKGIQHGHAELVKIAHVPGDDHQVMYHGRGGDRGIFDQGAGTAMLEPCQLAECRGTHGEQIVGAKHRIEPGFQFPRLGNILFPSQFNPRSSLSDRHHGQKQVTGSHTLKPGNDGWMRTGPSQFGYDNGVEQTHRFTRSWEMDGDEAAAVAASACPRVLRAPATVP